jgi:hypothetical protein
MLVFHYSLCVALFMKHLFINVFNPLTHRVPVADYFMHSKWDNIMFRCLRAFRADLFPSSRGAMYVLTQALSLS